MGIEANVVGSTAARDVLQLAIAEAEALPEESRHRFWEFLNQETAKKLPPPPEQTDKFNRDVVKSLGKRTLPFGEYKDVALDDVPLRRLQWLYARTEELFHTLGKYLASKRILTELAAEDEEDADEDGLRDMQ